ncbi:MAG: ABC transporter permease, partial [Nitrososphaera sp.]
MAVVDQNALKLALKDLFEGIHSIYIWPMLGWQDIKQRYRRSVLGPFWLTISNAALLGGMGPLYGRLLGQDINTYFAYLAVGFIIWMLIAGIINDSCNAFISAEGY